MAFLGKNTYIAFQYHLQWTTYIFKGCEQFAKFFLHWLTYKRKKNMTSLFPYFMFQTFTVLHHFRHDLQLFCDTSSLLHLKTAKHNWQYCFDQIHEYTVYIIYIYHIYPYTHQISDVQQSQPSIGPNFYFKKIEVLLVLRAKIPRC